LPRKRKNSFIYKKLKKVKNLYLINRDIILLLKFLIFIMGIGDWGLGIGDRKSVV